MMQTQTAATAQIRQPQSPTDSELIAELRRLHRRGWSVDGLAKRFRVGRAWVADRLKVQMWNGRPIGN